jgi:Gram-negative bacterial TonB protein C-terminal
MPVASVRMLSTESLHRLRRDDSSELGGILLGTTQRDEKNCLTAFINPEIISSQSRLYNTRPADCESIVAGIEAARNSGQEVMGYFRSHIRDGLCLSREDELLIHKHFRDPNSIFLIIRPFEIGICMAGFFFWEQGRLQTDASELEVPFVAPEASEQAQAASRASELESFQSLAQNFEKSSGALIEGTPLPQSAEPERKDHKTDEVARLINEANLPLHSERTDGAAPSTEVITQTPPLVRPSNSDDSPFRRSRPTLRRFTFLLTALLVACAGLYVWAHKSGVSVPVLPKHVSRSDVGLQVQASPGGQIDLSWDRTSRHLQTAQGAKLVITDGKVRRELYLDKTQLRFGRLTYFSNSTDVQFSLEIHLDNAGSISESIRVLPPQTGSAHVSRDTAVARSAHMPPESEPKFTQSPTAPRSSAARAAAIQEVHPRNTHAPGSSSPRRVAGQLDPARPEAAAVRSSRTKVLPPPSLERLTGGLVSAAPQIHVAAVPLPSPPQPDHLPSGVSPTRKNEARPTYVPAQPLRQVMPTKPPPVPSSAYHAVDIAVQVKIDEYGQVTEAHLIHPAASDAVLATRAISAAKQWTFEPAKSHGKNVPSEHTIVFKFRPVE